VSDNANAVADVEVFDDGPRSPSEAIAQADGLAQMQAAAELANGERPAWLPDQYDSGEQLAASYAHAQRKITEQGQELAELRAHQAQLLEQFAEFQEAALYEAPDLADHAVFDEQSKNHLIGVAAAADRHALAKLGELGLVDPVQVQVQDVAGQFLAAVDQVLTAQLPGWANRSEAAYTALQTNPVLANEFNAKFGVGDVSGAAATLANTYATLAARDNAHPQLDVHGMKVMAQTASGAGNRMSSPTSDTQEWESIKSAGRTAYWQPRAS